MSERIKNFTKRKEFGIILIILVLSVILTIMSDAFLRIDNVLDFLRSNAALIAANVPTMRPITIILP